MDVNWVLECSVCRHRISYPMKLEYDFPHCHECGSSAWWTLWPEGCLKATNEEDEAWC